MRNFCLSCFTLLLPVAAFATPADVPSTAWFAPTVTSFINAGYFPDGTAFRPGDNATRADFIQLIVKVQGGVTHAASGQSFDDVSLNADYYPFFEQAAASGWMKGIGSCYGTHPCSAKPDSAINRAEAAMILQRAFGTQLQGNAPSFTDNPDGQWFTDSIRVAASNCILQGDKGSTKVRPSGNMNRAEMVVMVDRLKRGLTYPNCTAEGQKYSLPKVSLPSSNAAVSMGFQGSTSSSIVQAGAVCTAEAWRCVDEGSCSGGFVNVSSCKLADKSCLNPEKVKPVDQRSCLPDMEKQLANMKLRIDQGNALVKAMETEAWKLITDRANEVFKIKYEYEKVLGNYSTWYEYGLDDVSFFKRHGSFVLPQSEWGNGRDPLDKYGQYTTRSVIGMGRGSQVVRENGLEKTAKDIELAEQQMDALELQYNNVERIYCRGDRCAH